MLGLTKVNDNWVPLQVKVFSRWVSNHLTSENDIEVKDISKDLSNGVALVELATDLTQNPPNRGWPSQPKLKVEMVQNCDLALDMFTKDGVNFVGISGKDISDNNQKLILGLIWTLILHYSIGKSVGNVSESTEKSNKQNSSDKKHTQNSKVSSKDALISWANKRIENYPNVHNFTPYDLSLCALLDTYFPQKINYYSLNPQDSEHNSRLATKVMEEAGIPIYVYPDELQKQEDSVDEKTLLTQLASIKVTLDNLIKQKDVVSTPVVDEKEDSVNDSDEEYDENVIGKIIKDERQIEDMTHEIEQLSNEIKDAKKEIEMQHQEKILVEGKLSDLAKSYSELKSSYSDEREARIQAENQLKLEEEAKNKLISEKEQILLSYSNLESERDSEQSARIQAESEVESLKRAYSIAKEKIDHLSSKLEEAKTDNQVLAKRLTELNNQPPSAPIMAYPTYQNTYPNGPDLQYQVHLLTTDIIHLENDLEYEKNSRKEFKSEIRRLRYAYDMIQNEKEIEIETRQDLEFEVEDLRKKLEETQKRSKETIRAYSKVIQNTIAKLHNEKYARKEAEVKVDLLDGALTNVIGDLYDTNQEKIANESKISDLKSEVERLSTVLEHAKDYMETQNDEKEELRANLIAYVSKNVLLENDVENEKEKKEQYHTENKRLRYALEIAQTENDFEAEMNDAAGMEVEQLKTENEKLKKASKRANETIKAYSKVIQKQLVENREEKEAIKEDALKIELLQTAYIQTVNDLNDASEIEGRVPNLEHEVKYLSRKLENYKTLVETQKEEKLVADQKVEILLNENSELSNQLKDAESEVDRLSYALESLQVNEDNEAQALDSAKFEISEMYSSLASAKYQVKRLEADYEKAQESINVLTNALNESQRQAVAEFDARRIAEEDAASLSKQVNELIEIINQNKQQQEEQEQQIPETVEDDIEGYNAIDRNIERNTVFSGLPVEGDNFEFAGKKFALTMTINGLTYNLSLVNEMERFMNQSGMKLDLAAPNAANDVRQQFTFGKDEWNTVIDSFASQGMVWDVANAQNWNPPDGTPFYLFPFHGRHNQHFVYKDGMIYAKQNGQVVTYVGGDVPFVMMEPNEELKDKQTFYIELL